MTCVINPVLVCILYASLKFNKKKILILYTQHCLLTQKLKKTPNFIPPVYSLLLHIRIH